MHYVAGRWDDSISNSRKVLENTLTECARLLSKHGGGHISDKDLEKPFKVRDYLEAAGALEKQEKETVATTYGLLSHTGGHPYMAQKDQARLLRHLALVLTEFVMLRVRGKIAATSIGR